MQKSLFIIGVILGLIGNFMIFSSLVDLIEGTVSYSPIHSFLSLVFLGFVHLGVGILFVYKSLEDKKITKA